MGAYVSREDCRKDHNVILNCTFGYANATNDITDYQGEITKGEFEGDPDIAGVGIFGTFIAVTAFALALSFLIVILSMIKHRIFPFRRMVLNCILLPVRGLHSTRHQHQDPETALGRQRQSIKPGFSEIFQGMVLSCSDAQIFTGAAYALTLRYFSGCTITAYHYNVVANLMLLTCATHLMAVTVVRNYWEYPWLAFLRVLCKTGVFLVTGILLSNQNADMENPFPTKIPGKDETEAPLFFLPAACFQDRSTQLQDSLGKSFGSNANSAILHSSPGNHVEGWNKFLIILLWYAVAVTMEIAMFIHRGDRRNGKRKKLINWFRAFIIRVGRPSVETVYGPQGYHAQDSATPHHLTTADRRATIPGETSDDRVIRYLKRIGQYVLSIYHLGGIAICMWTVATAGAFIQGLREWVQRSNWLADDGTGKNPENDATSFGQLVPIFTSALVLFTFLEMMSSATSKRRDAAELRALEARLNQEQQHHDEENPPPNEENDPANNGRPPNDEKPPQIEQDEGAPQLNGKTQATTQTVPVNDESTQPSTIEITPAATIPQTIPSSPSPKPSTVDLNSLPSQSTTPPEPTTPSVSQQGSFFQIASQLESTQQTTSQPASPR